MLEISKKKTKVMALTRVRKIIHILCNGVELQEQMEHFKYLVPLLQKMKIAVKRSVHAWVWLEI